MEPTEAQGSKKGGRGMLGLPAPIEESTSALEWGYWISHRLRRRRSELGLTQIMVTARLREVGWPVSEATYSRAEAGKVELAKGAGWLLACCFALDCSVTYLLGLSSDPERWEPDPEVLRAMKQTRGMVAAVVLPV